MLNILPYALAAYGGYRGYKANKDAGASGLNRILGGITGAAAGYYGGKMVPGVSTSGFVPFTQSQIGQGIMQYLPASMQTSKTNALAQGAQGALQTATDNDDVKRSMLQRLLYKKDSPDEIDPLKLFGGVTALTSLTGAFNQGPVDMYQPTYNLAYAQYSANTPNYKYIDPATGEEKEYEKPYIPEGNVEGNPYQMVKTRLATGGLAEIKKFNEGGINYLPSKTSHDEHDANNYVRATGYVEDGSGTGDKDEDTMLAQLADGEFVTRADGVLGAGLIAGGNPNSMKDLREKGAAYFYEQQKRYKRIFDLIGAAGGTSSKKN
jgi:hypothetical protein